MNLCFLVVYLFSFLFGSQCKEIKNGHFFYSLFAITLNTLTSKFNNSFKISGIQIFKIKIPKELCHFNDPMTQIKLSLSLSLSLSIYIYIYMRDLEGKKTTT